jgi:hypothetical protein
LNNLYFCLIDDIIRKKNKPAKKYLKYLKRYNKICENLGGYLNKHVWVIPDIYVKYNPYQRAFLGFKRKVGKAVPRKMKIWRK